MSVTPRDCEEQGARINESAVQLSRWALRSSVNTGNRDKRDRDIVYKLYRACAIREALTLLHDLKLRKEDLEEEAPHIQIRMASAARPWMVPS